MAPCARATPGRTPRTWKTAWCRSNLRPVGGPRGRRVRRAGEPPVRGAPDVYRIGIDVGGTFTDLVAVDDDGRVTLAKSPSTPADPSIGVMDGLAILAQSLGRDLAGLLGETERIVHGTTVATN